MTEPLKSKVMRRNKNWWGALDPHERSQLVQLERAGKKYGSGSWNLPEGYSGCSFCDYPCSGGGLCERCLDDLIKLIDKADNNYGNHCNNNRRLPG